jgi:hypothetical protein
MKPPEPDTPEGILHTDLRAALAEAIGDQQSVTLYGLSLEYRGFTAGDAHSKATQWHVDIVMNIEEQDEGEVLRPRQLTVGYLELWTLPLDECVGDTLDSISGDTAEYLQLIAADAISDDVADQFDDSFITGLLILDRAYIHPALRGRSLGLWAVVDAIRRLTFGSIGVLVVAHPTPTEDRSGISTAAAAKRLARHWGEAGLEPIHACPELVGQTTAVRAFDDSYKAFCSTAEMEIALPVSDLTA